jgi:hypothetical protein
MLAAMCGQSCKATGPSNPAHRVAATSFGRSKLRGMTRSVVVVWFFRAQDGHVLHRLAIGVGKAKASALTSQTLQNDQDLSRPQLCLKIKQ